MTALEIESAAPPVPAAATPAPRRGRGRRTLAVALVAVTAGGGIAVAAARGGDTAERQSAHRTVAAPTTVAGKIAGALKGGPASISRDATVADWPAKAGDGFAVLRQGGNGWTCLPDYPGSPSEDPTCADANGMVWFRAYSDGADAPHLSAVGISYWPLGNSDPSWSDPAAVAPPAGQDWTWDGPHITIFPANPDEVPATAMPSGHDHPGGTTAMFPGTPWAHYHVPLS